MYDVQLQIGGVSVGNFSEYKIVRSMYSLADTATFVATKKDYNSLVRVRDELGADVRAQVKIDGELVLTGFIADPALGYEEGLPAMSIKVNSIPSVLAGAYVYQGKHYHNKAVDEIIADMLIGSGVGVVPAAVGPLTMVDNFITSRIEQIDVVINRLSRAFDYMLYSDPRGNLKVERRITNGVTTSALVSGQNIINIRMRKDSGARFDRFKLYGQRPMSDALDIDSIINMEISRIDNGSSRQYSRVGIVNALAAKNMYRCLKNETLDITITAGVFKNTFGKVFAPNSPIIVRDKKWLEIDDTYLISDVVLQKNNNSYISEIRVEELA